MKNEVKSVIIYLYSNFSYWYLSIKGVIDIILMSGRKVYSIIKPLESALLGGTIIAAIYDSCK